MHKAPVASMLRDMNRSFVIWERVVCLLDFEFDFRILGVLCVIASRWKQLINNIVVNNNLVNNNLGQ